MDNKLAITVAMGMGLTSNLKHMERRQAWLQHMVNRGKFSLRYILTAEQPADFLTKALHYPAFNRCSVAIGQVDDDGVTCWVLVYVDDLLAASSSTAMLRELKELLEAAFELRKISPVVKYLGLEIVRDRPAKKLWLHQQSYADKLHKYFIDEEQGGRAQEREEEEYRQKIGSLQFAGTTTRPDIAFACSKLGSGLTVRSDQHWREVNHSLAYLADTRDTTLKFSGGAESLKLVLVAVESAATASIALVVVAVSAIPAASTEVAATKPSSSSSSAPFTAISTANA
ncbi:unnamed protein product [Closterium sp. NIES-54]